MTPVSIVWFRQDLRLADNPALDAGLRRGIVAPVYIWAPEEEEDWAPGGASRWWLHHSLASLNAQLERLGARMTLRRGPTQQALGDLIAATGATAVFWNRRYEPAAIQRDKLIKSRLASCGIQAESFNGSLLHEPWTIATKDRKPFQVFTPFWKACQATPVDLNPLTPPSKIDALSKAPRSMPLDEFELLPSIPWDAQFSKIWEVGAPVAERQLADFVTNRLADYSDSRDRIDGGGFSRLSPRLHFGEISARQAYHAAAAGLQKAKTRDGSEHFQRELGWREFAYHLLYHFPRTVNEPLRESFRRFPWSRSTGRFSRWSRGATGCPIVDAAMRDLWATGFIPNRARMIVASFLTKDLMIRWQRGAAWFWDVLVDADLANNTLGWQWTAGCGADAAPYFRVFNPVLQGEKFDPHGAYVRQWIPELARLGDRWIHRPWEAPREKLAAAGVELGVSYPRPIVDHHAARDAALAGFAKIRGS